MRERLPELPGSLIMEAIEMWKWPVIISAIVVVAVVGVSIYSAKRHSPTPIAAMPPSAPGSLRPGEKVSPHFISSIERVTSDTYKVHVKPIVVDPDVYLPGDDGGASMIELLVLDEKGNEAATWVRYDYPPSPGEPKRPVTAIQLITRTIGPPDKDGLNRRITATFKIDIKKLPKGTYTISARVEAGEEGKKAVQESSNLYSYVATRVTNYFTLVVK